MDFHFLPYPIRRLPNAWEVVMVDGASIPRYIHCISKEEAECVADARVLNGIVEMDGRAEIRRVEAYIDALRSCGLGGRSLLVRRIMSLLDQSAAT